MMPSTDFFSETMTTPAMMASGPLTPPSTDSAPTTIKMEDLHVPYSTPSPAPSSLYTSEPPTQTPAPSTSESKPVKKRKSWGQVLPEPKTSLPPRKRAKTEDEKEQRRIERVKRNRLAAHNSRERKRQETEHLQQQKDALEAEMNALRAKAAKSDKLEAELKRWHDKYPADVSELSDITFSFTEAADTINPAQSLANFPSPESMDSMDSPRDSSCQPETPASTFEATPEFDLTQYPAAMLCDLQCQSISGMASPMAAILAYLTLFNLYIQSMKSLLFSTTSSTSTSSLKALSQWNPALAWLITMISSEQASLAPAQLQTITAFLTALMQSSLTCRVPLAHLLVATRFSQQTTSFENVIRPGSEKSETGSLDDVRRSRLMRSCRLRQLGRRKGVQSWRLDAKRPWATTEGQWVGFGLTRRHTEL
ncbi:transcription factor that binds to CRE motif [Ascochyta rabiei]|uniref:transcription factor that binds to CRE motif n=1 Tax=Didymella rabiei TaxID=5454 RepID=UPI0021F93A22|nr:transcription factor that binds to CRE motif [Ascochyta rabiei]UPX14191.1 transcription factor that binds to CRE motif [Ascochyta rabiei]